jgi:hypothetical protein
MKIYDVTDERFRKYGRVLTGYDFTELCKVMEAKTPLPQDVVYEPSVPELEELDIAQEFSRRAYGELPIQVGYCNGNNYLLNAVEYHRNSELNIAVTDAILILGCQQDITDSYTYETSKMEAFRIPAGVGVEVYATTLHYAPCNVAESGFRVVVVLPKGTNYPLEEGHAGVEDALLTAKNKWLIGHPDAGLPEGTCLGLQGENLSVK